MYYNLQKTGFLEEMQPNMAPVGNDWDGIPGSEDVEMLTDLTIGNFIKTQESVLIMFYAPCKFHKLP